MEDGKYNYRGSAKPEIDRVRKTSCRCFSDIAEQHGIAHRALCYLCECLVDLDYKFFSESAALAFVPNHRILELGLRCRSKDDAEGHR